MHALLRRLPPRLARWIREQTWCPDDWLPHLLGAELGGLEAHEVDEE